MPHMPRPILPGRWARAGVRKYYLHDFPGNDCVRPGGIGAHSRESIMQRLTAIFDARALSAVRRSRSSRGYIRGRGAGRGLWVNASNPVFGLSNCYCYAKTHCHNSDAYIFKRKNSNRHGGKMFKKTCRNFKKCVACNQKRNCAETVNNPKKKRSTQIMFSSN